MPNIEILHMYVDIDGQESSFYHLLVDGHDFKYLSIEPGVYDNDDLGFPPVLLEKLPTLPPGDWNLGHVSKCENDGAPHFAWTTRKAFSSIENLWHPVQVDYRSLTITKMLSLNVYEVTCAFPPMSQDGAGVIAKLAQFPWEIGYYDHETLAYSWIEGKGIGPRFLGHIVEEDRTVGFLLKKVGGRHAEVKDLEACRHSLVKLHSLGITHSDVNKYNFLVPLAENRGTEGDDVCLIDFEGARKCDDVSVMEEEVWELERQLLSASNAGAPFDLLIVRVAGD